MKSINNVTIMGRVVRDPELMVLNDDQGQYTRFTLAVDRAYKNRDGKQETDFIPIIAWNKKAEVICQYIKKGSLILIDGRLDVRPYIDKDNNKRTSISVVLNKFEFMDSKKTNAAENKDNEKIS